MNIEGIVYCDFCRQAIFPEDVAPVKIKVDETTYRFHYHNRHNRDCSALELDSLKQRFAAAQQ